VRKPWAEVTMAAAAMSEPSICDCQANRIPAARVHAPISNAKNEQADQARPHCRQPRLISRYVGTRKSD
jgi:hypothetical protein